jgi:sec1 family domain-containing protein 1
MVMSSAAPGGAAEMLAREFHQLLRDHVGSSSNSLRGTSSNSSSSSSSSAPSAAAASLFEDAFMQDRSMRPLLVIYDRSQDLFPILQHQSTYQALISDLLDCKLNRVTVEVTEKGISLLSIFRFYLLFLLTIYSPCFVGGLTTKKKTYDLNTQHDHFLARYAGVPFPEAVENSEKELADISTLENSIRSKQASNPAANANTASSATAAGIDDPVTSTSGGKELSEAIESLPEILQRKQILETHTNLMQAMMRQIAARDIPSFFELEQALFTNGIRSMDRNQVLTLLRDGTKGSLLDKARLLAILAVLGDSHSLSKVGAEEYDVALQQGCAAMVNPTTTATAAAAAAAAAASDGNSASTGKMANTLNVPPTPAMIAQTLAAVAFIRKLVSLQQSSMAFGSSGGFGNSGGGNLQNFLASKANSLFAKAASFFTKFTPYQITRITSNLIDGRAGTSEDETFLYLDPRDNSTVNPHTQKFNDAIVFVIGGGCYSEYYNLQELVIPEKRSGTAGHRNAANTGNNSGSLRSLVYGCTDMLSGDEFIHQVAQLTTKANSSSTAVPNTPNK